MTRKEERRQVSIEYHNKPHYEAIKDDFLRGAEWADRTMLDKVCLWLTLHINDYVFTGHLQGEPFEPVNVNNLINDLVKAMEE